MLTAKNHGPNLQLRRLKKMANKNKERLSLKDFSTPSDKLAKLDNTDLMPLSKPLQDPKDEPEWPDLKDKVGKTVEATLDNTVLLNIPKPASKEEEKELIMKFLTGFEKLFTPENNWTFLKPLTLSMNHCAKCRTCSESCHLYEATKGHDLYEPLYRSEIFRNIYHTYFNPGGKYYERWKKGEFDLNWTTVTRLAELSYRCNLCRRCAQTCPIGVDNAVIARETRKLFSQELGITAKELHESGSMLQLKLGSSTGMTPVVVKDNVEFIDEDMEDLTGIKVETKWDVQGADVLLIHNAGEIMAWPENPGCFAIIMEAAGINWTLSSEPIGYDGINYGVWYDDMQFARVALKHAQIASKLGVKKIVVGECGHASKSLMIIADRILTGDLNIPRENPYSFLRDIVFSGKIKFDPSRNDFPVTLHDPCNLVRLSGIVEPQREILRYLCPQFREMEPHGVHNYCCGGGSGFAICSGHNFADWRMKVAGRKKLDQVLKAFENEKPETPKFLCAPCSNCKGQLRDILRHYNLFEKTNLIYSGLVELIVNAMVDVKPGFIKWEEQ
jgi:Fe-S oxidoreductase